MSIILGIVIVYIIDKKLSNITIKIPKLEPVIINKTVQVAGGKESSEEREDFDKVPPQPELPNEIRYWDDVPIQGRINSSATDVTINQKRKTTKAK